MAASRFSRFNRTKLFDIDSKLFVEGTFLDAKDIYEMDMEQYGQAQPHLLVGAWSHKIPVESRLAGLPDHSYTLGIKVEDKYYYVNCPTFMIEDFDSIVADKSLVKEINNQHCAVCPYEYEARNSIYYGLEFC